MGAGSLSITTLGTVTSASTEGIEADNEGDGGMVILAQGNISSRWDAIEAENEGAGTLSITTSGTVLSEERMGIEAENVGDGGVTIESRAVVTANDNGISIDNTGAGTLSITSTDEVISTKKVGIFALSSSGDIGINTAQVSGYEIGIRAENTGDGAIDIYSSGLVSSTGKHSHVNEYLGQGIVALSSGGNISITSDNVSAYSEGIFAKNYAEGTGSINITSTGTVTSANHTGVNAENFGGDEITINVADVNAGDYGIRALNNSSSDAGESGISITSTGTITSSESSGVHAQNYGEGNLVISVNNINAYGDGIYAVQDGTDDLTINVSGTVAADVGSAIALGSSYIEDGEYGAVMGTISNYGSLTSAQGAAISLGSSFAGTINNTGSISSGSGVALDGSYGENAMTFNHSAGTIDGGLLLGTAHDVVNITGGVVNGDILGQDLGTVNINLGAGHSFDAHQILDVEEYNIQSGTVNQLGNFSTTGNTTNVEAGATLAFNSTINGSGSFNVDGNLEFMIGADQAGLLLQDGTITFGANSSINIIYTMTPTLNEPELVISADQLDLTVDGNWDEYVNFNLQVSGMLYGFKTLTNGGDLSIIYSINDLGKVSPLANPSAFGDSIVDFVNAGGDHAVLNVLNTLEKTDITGFEQTADAFSPSVSGATVLGSIMINDPTWNLINQRQLEHDKNWGLWIHSLNGSADQDQIGEVMGFHANSDGISIGVDRDLGPLHLGMAYSSSAADIYNHRYANDQIEIESNQLTLYSGYNIDNWFYNISYSIAHLDYDFVRRNLVDSQEMIKGDTEGTLSSLGAAAGFHYLLSETVNLAPFIGLRHSKLEIDSFAEVGGLDLAVDYNNIERLTLELGVNLSAQYKVGDWHLAPRAVLAWCDEQQGEIETVSAVYASHQFTQTGSNPDQQTIRLGFGLTASNTNGLSLSLNFDNKDGSHYDDKQGLMSLRYEF